MEELETLAQASDSELAYYEGLIALAWADHDLYPNEKATLHKIVATHDRLNETQRQYLHDRVDQAFPLQDVWNRITDPRDRARFIDMANVIFQKDNGFCKHERAMIKNFYAAHILSLDLADIEADLMALTEEQKRQRDQEAAEVRAYAKQFSQFERFKTVFAR